MTRIIAAAIAARLIAVCAIAHTTIIAQIPFAFRVRELLRMTKLDTVLEMVADESSAIQCVAQATG